MKEELVRPLIRPLIRPLNLDFLVFYIIAGVRCGTDHGSCASREHSSSRRVLRRGFGHELP